MDNHRPSRAPSTIAVRTRLRSASPTISKQIEGQQRKPLENNDRLGRNQSYHARYNGSTGSHWTGPPSPTKPTSLYGAPKAPGGTTTTNLVHHASNKLRSRALSRASDSTPSPAKTLSTATTAPSSTHTSHPNSISLTRRRLSQPMESTPPKQVGGSHMGYHRPSSHGKHNTSNGTPDHHQHSEANNSNELVCDYDKSATGLYEMLEGSQWDQARSRCRTHPTEVRTWIVRRDKQRQVRWKLLPLHAAIIFQSPHPVISALLDQYPQAASCPDDQGMLPLHLAFRHKQDDEDLIELLLVQYPQAVLAKDKRQRLPLEHGRESKFSAKLMWLYADATVIGTRGNKEDDQTTFHSGLRADLEKELRREHEREISHLRNQYETELQTLQEKSAYETQHIKVVVDDERQTLVERHKEELNELKDLLNQQAEREANMAADLQAQIGDLQNALDNAARQNDGLTVKYSKMEEFNRALRNELQTIIRDQLFMRDLATRQNNELDAARKMRAQIIQTLMQQEDADGENDRMRSNKLIEVSENVRARLHDLLRNDPAENGDMTELGREGDPITTPGDANKGGTPGFGASRIEVERVGHDQNGFLNDQQGHNGGAFFEERDAVFLAKIPEVELRDADDALGEMKSLGDDISGITEQSPY